MLLVAAVLSLAFSGEAAAEEFVVQDDEGRSIHFDVRASGVNVEWYADVLRDAPHGDEISTVRVHVVSADELRRTCGRQAGACYDERMITVRAAQTAANASTLVHEYGHHLDDAMRVRGVREPNGTRTWWRARGIDRLIQLRSVYHGYVRGWDRNIAEIFAEDYARLARPGSPHKIRWLEGPNRAVLDAILFDLGLGPEPAITAPPKLKPVSFDRRGTLGPTRTAEVPFGLLGPGRRVRATITMPGADLEGVRGRLELRCDGRRISTRTLARGMRVVSIDRPSLGPAERCTVTVTNTHRAARSYALNVRLSVAL